MAPPLRTITVALDMSKAFDTINIHILIRKLLQTKIPGTIIKFIANYIKGHKAYTTDINNTSLQRQFKTGVPQGSVLPRTLFYIYTVDIPPPRAPVQVMVYADDVTITSTHTNTAKKYIQPYLHTVLSGQNKTQNPDKLLALYSHRVQVKSPVSQKPHDQKSHGQKPGWSKALWSKDRLVKSPNKQTSKF